MIAAAAATAIYASKTGDVVSQEDVKKFLETSVLYHGVFDVHLSFSKRTLAPAAAGIAAYVGTKFAEKKVKGEEKVSLGGKFLAAGVGAAGAFGTRVVMYKTAAEKDGLTPIMIVAITKDSIVLMDYDSKTNGPTRILFDFNKAECTIKSSKRGLKNHIFEISQEESEAKIECDLGLMSTHRKENKEVIEQLELIEKENSKPL